MGKDDGERTIGSRGSVDDQTKIFCPLINVPVQKREICTAKPVRSGSLGILRAIVPQHFAGYAVLPAALSSVLLAVLLAVSLTVLLTVSLTVSLQQQKRHSRKEVPEFEIVLAVLLVEQTT